MKRSSIVMSATASAVTDLPLVLNKDELDYVISVGDKLIGPQSPKDKGKKTLVLSLENLLINTHEF